MSIDDFIYSLQHPNPQQEEYNDIIARTKPTAENKNTIVENYEKFHQQEKTPSFSNWFNGIMSNPEGTLADLGKKAKEEEAETETMGTPKELENDTTIPLETEEPSEKELQEMRDVENIPKVTVPKTASKKKPTTEEIKRYNAPGYIEGLRNRIENVRAPKIEEPPIDTKSMRKHMKPDTSFFESTGKPMSHAGLLYRISKMVKE